MSNLFCCIAVNVIFHLFLTCVLPGKLQMKYFHCSRGKCTIADLILVRTPWLTSEYMHSVSVSDYTFFCLFED